jgi:nicotinate-nucleotide pyrophosphorylase (carboxylating)
VTLGALEVRAAVRIALEEDLGSAGDLTSLAVVPEAARARARLVARSPLVLAGVEVAWAVFLEREPDVSFRALRTDGDALGPGDPIAEVAGRARALLEAERSALNFLGRMCGIATATRAAVAEVAGTGVLILDTRKTAPGLRLFDKHAVAAGGGRNHRMGLWDAVMIKDTHLDAGCTIEQAVGRALAAGHAREKVTVEVRTPEEVTRAADAGAGRVLLDNMGLDDLRRAVALGRGRVVLEASGGLRPGALRAVAETGVDCMSLGWLTHSAPAADVAMEMETLA